MSVLPLANNDIFHFHHTHEYFLNKFISKKISFELFHFHSCAHKKIFFISLPFKVLTRILIHIYIIFVRLMISWKKRRSAHLKRAKKTHRSLALNLWMKSLYLKETVFFVPFRILWKYFLLLYIHTIILSHSLSIACAHINLKSFNANSMFPKAKLFF